MAGVQRLLLSRRAAAYGSPGRCAHFPPGSGVLLDTLLVRQRRIEWRVLVTGVEKNESRDPRWMACGEMAA
jgi:hypothetical protein